MSSKKNPRKKKSAAEKNPETGILFRERPWREIQIEGLKHPKPIPGYKATLPGAPGSWAKENPGA